MNLGTKEEIIFQTTDKLETDFQSQGIEKVWQLLKKSGSIPGNFSVKTRKTLRISRAVAPPGDSS